MYNKNIFLNGNPNKRKFRIPFYSHNREKSIFSSIFPYAEIFVYLYLIKLCLYKSSGEQIRVSLFHHNLYRLTVYRTNCKLL